MAVSRLRFYASTNGTFYIDLWKAISLQERKLHRQKQICTVYGGYFVDQDGNRVELNTAPLTWMSKRAVNRGFRIWKSMISDTLKATEGTTTGRWNDFKVYLNNAHGSAPLLPKDAGNNNLYHTGGIAEWDYSTLTSEDPDGPGGTSPDSFELMICGQDHVGADPNWVRLSLLKSWVDSRAELDSSGYPNQTNDVMSDPLANLFDAGDADDERMGIILSEGDLPPYDADTMFGNSQSAGGSNNLQRQSVAQPSAQVPVAPIHGFQALCGLVQVVVGSDNTSNQWELVLDVETKGESF
jgi:hypothetical protein